MNKTLKFMLLVALCLVFFGLENKAGAQTYIPTGLFAVDGSPDHLLFIGKDAKGIHVFEIKSGSIVEHSLKPHSMVYYDGGSMDLYLENGSRVVIPSQTQTANYLQFPLGPSFIHSDRPREELQARELDKTNFDLHGLTHLVNPDFFKPQVPASGPDREVNELADLSNVVLIQSELIGPRLLEAGRNARDAVVKEYVGRVQEANDGRLFDDAYLYIAEPAVAAEFLKRINSLGTLKATIIPTFVGSKILDAQVDEAIKNSQSADPEERNLLKSIRDRMSKLQSTYSNIYAVVNRFERKRAYAEAGGPKNMWGDPEVEETIRDRILGNPLYAKFLAPLSEAQRRLLEYAHGLDTPVAHEFVISCSLYQGVGIDFMARQFFFQNSTAVPSKGTYLDFWLNWLRQLILEADQLPDLYLRDELPEGWSGTNRSGGIFQHLKVSGDNIFSFRLDEGSPSRRWYYDQIPQTALVLLGIDGPELRASRRAVIQFVMDADRAVERQVPKANDVRAFQEFVGVLRLPKSDADMLSALKAFWRNDDLTDPEWRVLAKEVPTLRVDKSSMLKGLRLAKINSAMGKYSPRPAKGNELVFRFFNQLVYPPVEFKVLSKFSEALYYASVANIFLEFFHTTPNSIRTRGTFEFLLETAMSLVQQINSKFTDSSAEAVALRAQAASITAVIQKKLLEGINAIERTHPDACAAALSPNPFVVRKGFVSEETN